MCGICQCSIPLKLLSETCAIYLPKIVRNPRNFFSLPLVFMSFLFGVFRAEQTSRREKKRQPGIGDAAQTICTTLFFGLRERLPCLGDCLLGLFPGIFFFVQSSRLQITSQNKQEIVRWEGSECSRRAHVMFRSDVFNVTFWCNFTCIHVFENGRPLRIFYKVDSFHVIG